MSKSGQTHGPKRISGSWIDILHTTGRDGVYWNRQTLAYSTDDWRRLIRHLAEDFRLEYLMLAAVVVHRGCFLYPSALLKENGDPVTRFPLRGCDDPVRAIMEAAAEFDLKVFVGTGLFPETDTAMPDASQSERSLAWVQMLTTELLERYGHLSSFYGFYSSVEPGFQADGLLHPVQVEWTREYCKTMRSLSPERKILTSPHRLWEIVKADADLAALRKQIETIDIDYFVPQDGVGFDVPHDPRPMERAIEAFRRLKGVFDQTNTRFFANIEVFRFENDIHFQPLLPGPWERIEGQLRGVSPHVEKVFCYQIPGLMNSQKLFPRLGEPGTQELYESYRKYLKMEG